MHGDPIPMCQAVRCNSLVRADGVWAGLTRFTEVDGPVPWTPERGEIAVILEGSVRIEIAAGDSLELGVGDLFSLPPGVATTWHVTTPFKEAWVLAD
jgi:uncharacterized cupin superfamily protein